MRYALTPYMDPLRRATQYFAHSSSTLGRTRVFNLLFWILFCVASSGRQTEAQVNAGIQPLSSQADSGVDQIDLATLAKHVDIPLFQHRARGSEMGVNIHLVYDSTYSVGAPYIALGWRVLAGTTTPGTVIVVKESSSDFTPQDCNPNVTPSSCRAGYWTYSYSFAFTDSTGYSHPFGVSNLSRLCVGVSPDGCTNIPLTGGGLAEDGSGFAYVVNAQVSSPTPKTVDVYSPSGRVVQWTPGKTTASDTNGNTGYTAVPPAYWVSDTATLTDDSGITAVLSYGAYDSSEVSKWTGRSPTTVQYTDTSGTAQTVTVNYSLHALDIDCRAYGGVDQAQPIGLPDSVVYPDGSRYTFTYQVDGQLSSLRTPTGGTITYVTGTQCVAQGSSGVGLPATLTRTTLDGTTSYSQSASVLSPYYSIYPGLSSTTVSHADGSLEQVNFVYNLNYEGDALGDVNTHYETAHTWSEKDGTLLQSSMKCYNGSTGDCTTTSIQIPIVQIDTRRTLGQLTSRTVESMTASGLQTELDEYDFGSSNPVRKTLTEYQHFDDFPLMIDHPAEITVYSSGGDLVAATSFDYDNQTLDPTSGLPGHSAVTLSRGNLTTLHRSLLNTSTTVDTHTRYDDAGRVTASSDANGNWTSYEFDPAVDTCIKTTTYPKLASGLEQQIAATCDPNTGLRTGRKDANGVTTHTDFDSMLRPKGTTVHDASGAVVANTSITYGSSPYTIQTIRSASPNPDQVSTVTLDGFGRTSSVVAPDASTVDTTYDSMGRLQSVSNPYQSTSDPTYGITSYLYDGLGRKVKQCQADNGSSSTSVCVPGNDYLAWTYTDDTVLFQDEAGKQWNRKTDALGRLRRVLEPNGLDSTPTLQTDYDYDTLNNLTKVTQWGGASGSTNPITRSFTYDSLSRLLCAHNPENSTTPCPTAATSSYTSGTVGYTYYDSGDVHTMTNARGLTTTYTYDALNRLIFKSHSDGSRSAAFGYDGYTEFPQWGPIPGLTNAIGRLSHVSDQQTFAANFGYDAMGRTTLQQNLIPSNYSYQTVTSAQYDLAGSLIGLTYPDGLSLSQTSDSGGRLSSVSPTGSTTPYYQVNNYLPSGAPAKVTYGNGVVEEMNQNNRLQSCEHSAFLSTGLGGTMVMDKQYFFGASPETLCGSASGNNGNIFHINDVTNTQQGSASYSQNFRYDTLNRLIHFDTAIMGGQARGQNLGYDNFGNLRNMGSTSTASANVPDPLAFSTASQPGNNRMTMASFRCLPLVGGVVQSDGSITPQGSAGSVDPYDAAGNAGCTGTQGSDAQAFVWDADNRISQVWSERNNNTYSITSGYFYDALGNRARAEQAAGPNGPASAKEYITFGGEVIAEKNDSGAWTDYIYAGGKKVARIAAAAPMLHFYGQNPQSGVECGFLVDNGLNYTVRSGDRFSWREYKSNAVGGIAEGFEYGNNAWSGSDTDGHLVNQDTRTSQWLSRSIDLSPYAGHLLGTFLALKDVQTGTDPWDIWYADMAIYSADGSVQTILGSNGKAAINTPNCQGPVTSLGAELQDISTAPGIRGSGADTHYYLGDHLGTSQLEFSAGGWPVWRGEFAPFGQELDGQSSANRYMFTGKERDTESGLDYFGARYYGSGMGRFMSPDPHNPILIRQGSIAGGLPEEAANSSFLGFLNNPQNWNQYAYVRNNPLNLVDRTGGFAGPPGDGHHLLPLRGNIASPLAKDFANAVKTGGPNPASNVWGAEHAAYNNAEQEILQGLEQTQGDSNAWSLSQWKDFATKVLNSDEPAIKSFLDQIEVELPGSRAKLAAAVAAYQPSKAVVARTYTWAIGAGLGAAAADLSRIFSDFFICFTCSIHYKVTSKVVPIA